METGDDMIKRLSREKVYQGAILDIYKDEMLLPDGSREAWDFVSHRMGAAAIVAVTEDKKILMVKQYRPALNRYTLELPAGCRDSLTEDTLLTSQRELREETGYISNKWQKLLSLKTTVAFCDESVDVYLAEDIIKEGQQELDPAEEITFALYDSKELLDMIYEGRMQDGKTIAGILAYLNLRG
jgi:ADP-ribose pyrophosphatase